MPNPHADFIAQYRKTHGPKVFAAATGRCPCCGKTGCTCTTKGRCDRCWRCPTHCLCKGGPQQAELFEGFVAQEGGGR